MFEKAKTCEDKEEKWESYEKKTQTDEKENGEYRRQWKNTNTCAESV